MTSSESQAFTQLLIRVQNGDRTAVEAVTAVVYDELRRLAGSYIRHERPDHTLQATALVHEVYVKLADQTRVTWESRAHFFGIASRLMRQILVDYSRRHQAAKRGSGLKVPLNDEVVYSSERASELIALDDALTALATLDARKAQMIEMRYFGGLTGEEIAEAIGVSTATVTRELRLGQAWLSRELGRD